MRLWDRGLGKKGGREDWVAAVILVASFATGNY